MDAPIARQADQLVDRMRPLETCIVAYSGGVDSAVVAKAACLALGDGALAVTGESASLATGELDAARRIAAAIGIRHETISTREFTSAAYIENAPDRCYHCKTELYTRLQELASCHGFAAIANGANADDCRDFRPGMQAAQRYGVVSPLAACDFNKTIVRNLARHWQLEIWNKPATPCLSSRVAYGVAVTPERLNRIDAAETILRAAGLAAVRVRLHENDLARLEVSIDSFTRLCEPAIRRGIVASLQDLGFRYITLDLEGFRSGSFQQLVPVEDLTRFDQMK